MNLLLDTHALLWFVAGDSRLTRRARQAIEARETVNFVSMVSWWEVALKCSLGKLSLDDSLEAFMDHRTEEGFRLLPLEPQHLHPLLALPFHHRDPFDRLIICQALIENMAICTGDASFARYDVKLVW